MKLKKVLAMVLCVAMVLGTMSFTVFAEVTNEPVAVECNEETPISTIAGGAAATITNSATSKNDDYDDIDDAFDALEKGDTITISAGIHYLNNSDEWHPRNAAFNLPDDVTIIGEEGAVIEREPYFYAKGLKVKNVDFVGYASVAMRIHGNATFEDCTLLGPNGIYYSTVSESLKFVNCTIYGDVYGLQVGEGNGTVIVEKCNITGWNSFGAGVKPSFKECTFNVSSSGYGSLRFYDDSSVSDSTFDDDYRFIDTDMQPEVKFDNCKKEDGSSIGDLIDTDGNPTIILDGNTISGTIDTGVVFDDAAKENDSYIYFELENISASKSIEIKLYSGTEILSTTSLVNTSYLSSNVLGAKIEITDDSSSWDTVWETMPIYNKVPDKAELYIDSVLVDTADVRMYSADTPHLAREWEDIEGVFHPNIHSTYLGGTYDNAYLCVEVYDFYLGETFDVKYFSNGEHIATASLKEGMLSSGAKDVIGCCLGFNGDFDEYWTTEWIVPANAEQIPDRVEVYVDGTKIAETDCTFGNGIKGWDPASNGNWLYALINEDWIKIDGVHTVAKVGEKGYATIQAAVNAVVAGDNEIVILPGTYDESFMVTQKEGVNITIKAENKGDVVLTNQVKVCGDGRASGTDTLTFENLVFDASDKTAAFDCIFDDKGSKSYSYLHNMTVRNCDFIGNGQGAAAPVVGFRAPKGGAYNTVFENCTAKDMFSFVDAKGSSNINITDSTFTNMSEGVFNAHHTKTIVFNNNYVEAGDYAVRSGQTTYDKYDTPRITMNGNTIYAKTALALRNVIATAEMNLNTIVADSVFTNDDADDSTINNVAITAEEIDEAINNSNYVIPDSMAIRFVQVEPGLYDIMLTADDDIYEFVGAELTFKNSSTTAAGAETVMNYEILGIDGVTNAEKSIKKDDTYALRLVADAERMSGKELKIGQVKFYGQGNITFTVSEGEVVTTEYGTNLGQYYTLDTDDTTTDNLIVNGITNNTVEEVTRDVVVNVAFNHKVRENKYWNNDMFIVTVKDGFGNVQKQDLEITSAEAGACDFTVKLAEDAGRITVTLEAPGFRKYVYNTTVEAGTEPLVLNFWNNVKRNEEINGVVIDPAIEIEAGTNVFKTDNFLVGDIVMDYTVDKYDLAAVTSYYGMYELTDADKYIKYDLNRDGNIDIRDVHYVLHTLNN